MTEEIAKQASELLAKKSELTKSLGILVDPNNKIKNIELYNKEWSYVGGNLSVNTDFCKDDLHAFLLRKLKLEIALVDDQLEGLNCV